MEMEEANSEKIRELQKKIDDYASQEDNVAIYL